MAFPTVVEICPEEQDEEQEAPDARKDLSFQFAGGMADIGKEAAQHTDQGSQPKASGGGNG